MLTVPSSNSRIARFRRFRSLFPKARWQSGYAAACKAVYAGSIPTLASIYEKDDPSMGHFHVATQNVVLLRSFTRCRSCWRQK